MNTIRLLIADDHELIRRGLREILVDTEIEVVAEASNGEEALSVARAQSVDVILLDVRMPHSDGLSALHLLNLEHPTVPVLLLSAFDNPTYVARAAAMKAKGFLLKSCSAETLIAAIRTAAQGEETWTRDELRRVTGAMATPRLDSDVDAPLTQRESEVLKQLALGLTNKEIAQALHISYETVKEHVQHILRKIGVSDRTQAAVWAVRKNLA